MNETLLHFKFQLVKWQFQIILIELLDLMLN